MWTIRGAVYRLICWCIEKPQCYVSFFLILTSFFQPPFFCSAFNVFFHRIVLYFTGCCYACRTLCSITSIEFQGTVCTTFLFKYSNWVEILHWQSRSLLLLLPLGFLFWLNHKLNLFWVCIVEGCLFWNHEDRKLVHILLENPQH